MKKHAFIIGLILLSSSMAMARCCDCCDCYNRYNYPPPRLHTVKGHTHFIVNYPQTGISINVGNNYGPIGRAIRGNHYPPKRNNFGASIHLAI